MLESLITFDMKQTAKMFQMQNGFHGQITLNQACSSFKNIISLIFSPLRWKSIRTTYFNPPCGLQFTYHLDIFSSKARNNSQYMFSQVVIVFINKVVQKISDVILITLSDCFLLPLLFVLCCIRHKGNDVMSPFSQWVTYCVLLDYKCLQGKRWGWEVEGDTK
jgi:hypothetical protein